MIGLTRKTDYALVALTYLAVEDRPLVSAREVSESFGGSTSLLMNVLKQLAASGLVKSIRGAKGGYRLSVSPAEIHLDQVIEAMEGPIRLTPCVGNGTSEDNRCSVGEGCPIHGSLEWLHGKMMTFIHGITLADLAAAGGARRQAPLETKE